MANFPVPNGYAEVGIVFRRTGLTRDQVITFGVKLKATPTAANMEADVRAAWTAAGSMNGGQPPSIVARFVDFDATYGGTQITASTAALWTAGGGNPSLLPMNCGMVAKKLTASSGRKNRGRFFVPWASESDYDAFGIMPAGTVTAWTGGLQTFRAALAAAGRTAVNGMYILHHDGSTPTLVTSMVMRNTIGTQRRRQPV